MKIMQILENRKIEKKLRKEIMPSAWETIEDMTGRTIIDKSSLSVKIEDMDHYIQGKCSGNKSIILNTVHAYSAYHSSKKEFYKWAYPLLVHEGYHYAQAHYDDKHIEGHDKFQPQTDKIGIMNKKRITKNRNIMIIMDEAPAYFIGAYANSKIFAKEMNELWQNRASLIRHKMISILCCFSENWKKELSALFDMITNNEISSIDEFRHGAYKEKSMGSSIALIMFAANGYSILETMKDLDKPAAGIIDALARKLKNKEYSDAVKENVYEMARIKIRIDKLYGKFESKEKNLLEESSDNKDFLKKLIKNQMQLKTSLIYKMRKKTEAQKAENRL